MAQSTLDPALDQPEPRPKGHDTASLGPSGSSDSGSDLIGPGLAGDPALGFDTRTTSDLETSPGAGHDVGDANLDSDSDESGTGEHATAGRDDDVAEARDIVPDRIIGADLPIPADALDRIAIDYRTADDANLEKNADDGRKDRRAKR